jgi:hypothetical protein
MTAPLSQASFRGPRDSFVGGAIAHLRLAVRLPLRVTCQCRAHWDDPALDQHCFEREVDLGMCADRATAVAKAGTAVALGLLPAERDPDLRLVPQFITILDAEHRLVLAGDVQSGQIRWCAPVDNDAEARRVVIGACRFRAEARAAMESGDPSAADVLLGRARASAGRLVDPFWRDLAKSVLGQAQAA